MQEIQTEKPSADNARFGGGKNISDERALSSKNHKSKEPFFGALLFAFMILFVLASIGAIGFVVYSRWKNERALENRPSIAGLIKKVDQEISNVMPGETNESADSKTPEETKQPTKEEIVSSAKKLKISVLNGGAARGSAGAMASFLKQEGYLKIDVGNTLKDYTGAVVYFAAPLEKEAEAIKESVIKKYPQAKILPADQKDKETIVSQITIILAR